MKLKEKEYGFGAIEALLILIIIGVVGFAGWYVYHAKNSTNNTYNKAANTNVTTQSTAKTTSEQPNKTKFNELFSSYSLGKLAIGKQISPPSSVPTNTTSFNTATDQFCTSMTTKKLIPANSYATAIYNVSTKQNDEQKSTWPQEIKQGGTIGCEPMPVLAGSYESKAYIDDVLVVDLPFTIK